MPVLHDEARFQQRQMEEKEQKLVRMYEAAQARTLGRLAGSPTNAAGQQTINTETGKVRQMFQERRTKAGIDKSYPLQPLAGVTRGPTRPRPQDLPLKNHERDHDTVDFIQKPNGTIVPLKSQVLDVERCQALEPPSPSLSPEVDLETVVSRLPNVGGALPSQRNGTGDHQPQPKTGARKILAGHGETKKLNGTVPRGVRSPMSLQKPPASTARSSPPSQPSSRVSPQAAGAPSAAAAVASPPRAPVRSQTVVKTRQAPPHKSSTPSSETTSSSSPKTPSSHSPTPVLAPMASKAVIKQKAASPAARPAAASAAASPSSAPSSPPGPNSCRICLRSFAPDRLLKHQEICSKAATKKRKPFDSLKHRVAGTEAEAYVRPALRRKGAAPAGRPAAPAAAAAAAAPAKQSNWRKKHEEFINAIRAAKEMQAFVAKGGKLSDLPPPPPSENADYVGCPHCSRRFNAAAAARHIPQCANFQFNKKGKGTPTNKRR